MFKKKKGLWITAGVVVALIVACVIYLGTYYRAGEAAKEAMKGSDLVKVEEISKGVVAFIPENPVAGFIFYPGGKVEYTAYAPLLETCAEYGILCILVKMPGNLAIFDMNAADGLQEKYPEIKDWYIGGHSLGGAMAANYVAAHTDDYKGLVLLAAYSTKDISGSGLSVLCCYGTEDQVMNRQNYDKYMSNLPSDYRTYIIEGGNHGNFGDYGAQSGDGTATITGEEQNTLTALEIVNMIVGKPD